MATFRSASQAYDRAADVTPAEPTGAAAGDFLHVQVMSSEPLAHTMSADWTQIQSGVVSGAYRFSHFWMYRGASAPSYTVSNGAGTCRTQVIASAYSGVASVTPYDGLVALSGGTAADTTYPAQTAAGGGRLAVRVRGVARNPPSSLLVDTGWTSQAAFSGNTGSPAAACQLSTRPITAAGTDAAFAVANDSRAQLWAAGGFYLIEPVTGGQIKHWNGSAWVLKPVKHWNGTAFVEKPLKRWNGSAWVLT